MHRRKRREGRERWKRGRIELVVQMRMMTMICRCKWLKHIVRNASFQDDCSYGDVGISVEAPAGPPY